MLTKILTGESEESEESEKSEDKSYHFRLIHETILRYLCHAWTDFIEIGLIRKLICGLHKKNAFKFR